MHLLQPGGIFRLWDVVYDFDLAKAGEHIEAWCSGYETSGANRWVRADLEEHIRDEYSTFTWLLEPMIERSGFAIECASYTNDGMFAKYVLRAV